MTLSLPQAPIRATLQSHPLQLRPGLPTDAPAIAEVHQRSRAASLWPFLSDAQLDTPDVCERIRRWEELLATPCYHALLLEANGRLAGFATWRAAPDEDLVGQRAAELHTLYVRPSCWGGGVGSTLLTSALRQMRAWWHEVAVVWSLEVNVRARRFYLRHGFELDGAVKLDRAEDGEPFVGLRHSLPLSHPLPCRCDLTLTAPT